MKSGRGPLEGIRVVDLSSSYAGPTATMYLGDMGAEVLKIERPGRGDDARAWGPPFLSGDSAWFVSANRNKRSVCIDLRAPDGLEVLHRLLAGADVLVENINPGKLERMGLHPDQVLPLYPGLIYCAVSGFGLDGPDSQRPGYDLVAQARSGLMSVTGPERGMPERVSTALSDVVAGMLGAFTVSAALVRRGATGEGELIDVSLLESDLALMAPRVAAYLAGGPEPRPSGATDSVLAVYRPFQTADGVIVLAVGNDGMWRRCCDVLGLDDLRDDPALATNAGRAADLARLVGRIQDVLVRAPAAEWLERFARADVPCQPVQCLSEVVADPQLEVRGAIGEYEHPVAGRYRAVRAPWRTASTGRGPDAPAPLLGADTIAVLEEAGLELEEIANLVESGAVWAELAPTP